MYQSLTHSFSVICANVTENRNIGRAMKRSVIVENLTEADRQQKSSGYDWNERIRRSPRKKKAGSN